MNRIFFLITLISLAGCVSTSAVKQADYGPTGPCESFYKANPDVIDYGHQRTTNPSYILVDADNFNTLEQRYLNEGYIRIGASSFSSSPWAGEPEKDCAINFAKKIEAEHVIYSLVADPATGRSEHMVGFYAKSR